MRERRLGVIDGRRISVGASGPSFNSDTRRPEEFLPSMFLIYNKGRHSNAPVNGMRPDSRKEPRALTREGYRGRFGSNCSAEVKMTTR